MSVSTQTTQILIITCVARDSRTFTKFVKPTSVRFHVYNVSRVETER